MTMYQYGPGGYLGMPHCDLPNLCPAKVNITPPKKWDTLNPPKSEGNIWKYDFGKYVKYNRFLQQPTEIFPKTFSQSDVDI